MLAEQILPSQDTQSKAPIRAHRRRLLKDSGLCLYCKIPLRPGYTTVDHVTPISQGGQTTRTNVVLSCQRCNRAKGNRTAAQWLRDLTDAVEFIEQLQTTEIEGFQMNDRTKSNEPSRENDEMSTEQRPNEIGKRITCRDGMMIIDAKWFFEDVHRGNQTGKASA